MTEPTYDEGTQALLAIKAINDGAHALRMISQALGVVLEDTGKIDRLVAGLDASAQYVAQRYLARQREEATPPAEALAETGCCSGCKGTGISGDPDTNGQCNDCRGTGCPHVEPRCTDPQWLSDGDAGPGASPND